MKPLTLFFIVLAVMASLLFLLPINLFDGEVITTNGLQTLVEKKPLSLSYFVGMGYNPADMINVVSFRLMPTGYVLAVIFLFGIPALIAYRFYLSLLNKNKA